MADSGFLVTISSPALSLLLYENVRNPGNQMGFLLGETLEFVGKTYTDADNQVETMRRYNHIQAIVTCPLPECLHSSIGRINTEQLSRFLRDNSKRVVGWFRFRQSMNLMPTFRDKTLHKEFASYFSNINGSKEEFFVACLLSSSTSNERGNHKFKHIFLRQRNGTFEPVPLRIKNLGSDSLEGSDYKPTPSRKSPDEPDMFSELIASWNLNLTKMTEVECAGVIQKTAEQHFNQLIPRLCKSDLEVAQLEKQVRELKLRKMKRMNGKSRDVAAEHKIELDKINEDMQNSGEMCVSRIESMKPVEFADNNYLDCLSSKGQSIRTSQNSSGQQITDLGREAYIDKNVNAHKSRTDANTMDIANQESLPTYSVLEMKNNIPESFANKNKRSSVIESEIVKDSICKGNVIGIGRGTHNAIGIGRGSPNVIGGGRGSLNVIGGGRGAGKPIQNTNSEPRKGRTASGPAATRSSSESTLHTGVPKQESSQANRVQSMPFQQTSYSNATKKKVHTMHK